MLIPVEYPDPISAIAILEPMQPIRRCRECGHRTPDPQLQQCSECGAAVDHAEHGLYFRGVASGWLGQLGTAGGSGLWLAAVAPLSVAVVMIGNWNQNRALAVGYGLGFGVLTVYMLLKRMLVPPDALVVAYVGADGYAQVDALPRWPIVDALVIGAAQSAIVAGALSFVDSIGFTVFVALLLASFLCFFTILSWQSRRRSLIELLHQKRHPWSRKSFASARSVSDHRVRLRVSRNAAVFVDIEFEGAEVAQLQACLNHWKSEALASTPPPLSSRRWSFARALDDALSRVRARADEMVESEKRRRAARRGRSNSRV